MVFFLFCSPRAAKETGPSQTQPCDTTQLDDKEVMTAKQGLYQKLTTLTNWCRGVIIPIPVVITVINLILAHWCKMTYKYRMRDIFAGLAVTVSAIQKLQEFTTLIFMNHKLFSEDDEPDALLQRILPPSLLPCHTTTMKVLEKVGFLTLEFSVFFQYWKLSPLIMLIFCIWLLCYPVGLMLHVFMLGV